MKNVIVVEGGWDYDGSQVIGVFDNEEEADAAELKAKQKGRFDWVSVNEYTINKTYINYGEEEANTN